MPTGLHPPSLFEGPHVQPSFLLSAWCTRSACNMHNTMHGTGLLQPVGSVPVLCMCTL